MKFNPDNCVFSTDGASIGTIDELFDKMVQRKPSLKMYVYEKLDDVAGFSTIGLQPDKVVRLTRDELHNLVKHGSSYAVRTNDVFISCGDGYLQTMVVSCMGQMIFEGD